MEKLLLISEPSAPNNLREVAVTVDSLTVEWNAPDNTNFESYEIILKQGATTVSTETLAIGSGLTHTFTGLSAATAYVVTLETIIMEVHSEQIRIDVNTSEFLIFLLVLNRCTMLNLKSWLIFNPSIGVHKLLQANLFMSCRLMSRPLIQVFISHDIDWKSASTHLPQGQIANSVCYVHLLPSINM